MNYIRVVIKDVDTEKIIKSLGFKLNYKFEFIDHCFMCLNIEEHASTSLKIREYKMNEWKCKDVLVIKKEIIKIGDAKKDKLLDHKEFSSLFEAQEYVKTVYPEFTLAFAFSRKGVQYTDGNIQIWVEDVEFIGKSIEIGFENEADAKKILDNVHVVGILYKPLPEIVYEFISRS